MGGQIRRRLARLDATTGLPDSFDPDVDGSVISIAVQPDGKILAGGQYDTIGAQIHRSFARLSNDTAALQNLAVTQTTVTWVRGGSSRRFARVIFEYSPDNVTYTSLGNGTAEGSSWILTDLSFPTETNFYIRARGIHNSGDGSGSITESVRNVFLRPAAQALNLSTRMFVETGDRVGIAGFIITGSAPKQVLLRVLGPSMAHGFRDVLDDPVLELHGPAGFATITNDNWRDTQEEEIEATGIPPGHDVESAIVATLAPGAYTAVLRGNNQSTGSAVVEIYDLSHAVPAKLANISTRAFVGTDEDIVIAGFILGGNSGDDRIIVRGIGPSLAALGVPDALANPTLDLRDTNGAQVVFNNDWQDDPAQAAELTAAGLAPTHQLESGLALTLPPGLYTALLGGLNGGIGVGLVEVYDLGAP